MSYASPKTSRAARLDAEGKHDEAIDQLAKATQEGDLAAQTILGKRLLVGDRAPYLPKDGASLVMEAAHKGVAEAVATMSILQCIGVYQQKNWGDALNTLTHAACLGWAPARAQLLLLSPEPVEGAADTLIKNEGEAFWLGLGKAIDINKWFRIPSGEVLSDGPMIVSFRDFIPPDWCSLFMYLAAPKLKPALVYDAGSRRNYRSETRNNSIAEFNLVENQFIHFLMQERMSAACGVPMNQMEGTAILHYRPGEEISEHYDFVDPKMDNYEAEIRDNGQRIITFLIYLNDNYDGGETTFPELGISHKGRQGEGLYFVNALQDGSPDLRTRHAGTPPTSGEKWIVSQFIRNREVKYVM